MNTHKVFDSVSESHQTHLGPDRSKNTDQAAGNIEAKGQAHVEITKNDGALLIAIVKWLVILALVAMGIGAIMVLLLTGAVQLGEILPGAAVARDETTVNPSLSQPASPTPTVSATLDTSTAAILTSGETSPTATQMKTDELAPMSTPDLRVCVELIRSLAIRTQPDSNALKLDSLPRGETVEVISETGSGESRWLEIVPPADLVEFAPTWIWAKYTQTIPCPAQ